MRSHFTGPGNSVPGSPLIFSSEVATTAFGIRFNAQLNSTTTVKTLTPGLNDVFDFIFNGTFFNDCMITRVLAVNLSEVRTIIMSTWLRRV